MRMFIALPVTAEARRALEDAQNELHKKGVRGRFTPPENFHITLAFLGNADDPAPVTEALRRVRAPETALRFDRITLFGDVLAARLKNSAALENYVRELRAELDAQRIGYDRQTFIPHITLVRKTAFPYDEHRLSTVERKLRGFRLPVKKVCLMASDLSGETPRYTAVYTKK